jgi:hypothetical protein
MLLPVVVGFWAAPAALGLELLAASTDLSNKGYKVQIPSI